MAETIWKYSIPLKEEEGLALDGTFTLLMPLDAYAFSVGEQYGKPVLWAMVDSELDRVEYKFLVVGTGIELPEIPYATPIGTVLLHAGSLVLHIFDCGTY